MHPPVGPSYTWTANVASGTDLFFLATDSEGRSGGCTERISTSESDDESCLTSALSSTSRPTQTHTSSQTHSQSQTYPLSQISNQSTHQPSHSSGHSVIGPAIGGGVGAAFLLVTAAIKFLPVCHRTRCHEQREGRPRSFILRPREADTRVQYTLNEIEQYHGSTSQLNFPNDSVQRPHFLDVAPSMLTQQSWTAPSIHNSHRGLN